MKVNFAGSPVTLWGVALKPGDTMPDFMVTDTALNPVKGSALAGPRVFVSVPSLDTEVCDLEVRRFNEKAAALPGVTVYAISMDLPFAQARWCGANGIANVKTLSDYKTRSFGKAAGTLIEELGLLTRAIIVVGADNRVVYAEYVPEVTDHPQYEEVYRVLEGMVS